MRTGNAFLNTLMHFPGLKVPSSGSIRFETKGNGNKFTVVAKDIVEALGNVWSGSTSIQHIPRKWHRKVSIPTLTGLRDCLGLTEEGLYFYISRCDKPIAAKMMQWILSQKSNNNKELDCPSATPADCPPAVEQPNLQIFNNPAFGNVRVILHEADGEPWFVAKDVCRVLNITNHKDAISVLDDDEKSKVGISDPHGREQETLVISESGLYSLLFRSRKPIAKTFSRWVRHEVIPTIRKHGGYGIVRQQSGQTPGTINPELSAIILERLSAIEASLAPVRAKANRYDAFLSFDGTCGLTEAVKLFGMSAIAFGKLLRSDSCHWLFKRCDGNARPNMPTKPVVDAGYMVVKIVKHKVGRATYMHSSARFTPKGLDALRTHLEKLGLVDETPAALPCISEATIDCQVTTVTQ